MTVTIEYETDKKLNIPYEEIIHAVVQESLAYENCPYEAEVNVILTDNIQIRQLNLKFRGIDSATDVLSFPMIAYDRPADFNFIEEHEREYFHPESGELLLGDIVISVEKVLEQAEKYGHTAKRELAFLTAHSMMHLFGYDHMLKQESEVMEYRQNEVLKKLEIKR